MNTQPGSIYGMFAVVLLIINAVILETALAKNADWYNALWVTLPLFVVAICLHKRKSKPAVNKPADDPTAIVFD